MLGEAIDRETLRQLGDGAPLADVLAGHRLTRAAWDASWQAELRRRAPDLDGKRRIRSTARGSSPSGTVEIVRDGRGFPHVRASNVTDLFFGYGYTMAQDRIFQMDLRRRRGEGRLAEILGAEGLEADRMARAIGLHLAAQAEATRLDADTRTLLEAFAAGVNAQVAESDELPAIEFDLLGYRPEPWTVEASTACAMSWRWQLTGRPLVVVAPELVKRALGDGPLYRRFVTAQREANDVSIVPDDSFPRHRVGVDPLPPTPPWAAATADSAMGDGTNAEAQALPVGQVLPAGADGGSNNWVVAGSRSRSGKPLVVSDPHLPYEATSSLYEVHLQGGSFDVAGAGWVGVPGITIGRNPHMAWGITNNICSLRDLYAETEHAVAPLRTETIAVRGADSVTLEVHATQHGPIVDELLPPVAAGTGPVSMRWAGVLPCDWTAAQLRIDRARSVADAMEAARGWRVPTFSVVFADTDGVIGYLATGSVPIRELVERGYRAGGDTLHDWIGSIPSEGMPRVVDPERGYLVTANNRPAPDDFPYPLSGTWDEGLRSRRIGSLIEAGTPGDAATMAHIQNDTAVHRARRTVPALVYALDRLANGNREPDGADTGAALERRLQAESAQELASWDGMAGSRSRGAAIYEVLFTRWMQAVARERLGNELGAFAAPWTAGLAASVLAGEDDAGWFPPGRRDTVLLETAAAAIRELATLLGSDIGMWRWGRLHQLRLRHPLAARGSLAELFEKPAAEVGGDPWTISNSGFPGGLPGQIDASAFEATSGAGYRMVVDLGESPACVWTVTGESQSGHPGSAHWNDQLADFVSGRIHRVPMDPSEVDATVVHRLVLVADDTP